MPDVDAATFMAPVLKKEPVEKKTGDAASFMAPVLKSIEPEQKFTPEESASLLGREPGIDYSKGASFSTRYNLFRASQGAEEELYLKNTYGEGNYRKDRGGNWLVKPSKDAPWMPVYPSGVLEGLETAGGYAAGTAPTMGGAAAGAAIGTAIEPGIGTALGAFVGAAGARGIDEATKYAQGFYSKDPAELAMSMYGEGALAGLSSGLGPGVKAAMPTIYGSVAKRIGGLGSVTPESRDILHSLERLGVTPPIQSVAPALKAFEYDRYLRNIIAKDPRAAGRISALDTRMKEVLGGFGLTPQQVDAAFAQITNKSEALSGREVGAGVVGRLKARETALLTDEATYRGEAERALQATQRSLDVISERGRTGAGPLAQDVASAFEGARHEFTNNMNQTYGAITRMTGNVKIVDISDVSQQARELVQTMDPQAVPPIIARLARGDDPAVNLLTFGEAHNLRTTLREMAKIRDLSPIGQRRGNIRFMAASVDDAIVNSEGRVGQQAAALLRVADKAYSEGVVRFTNQTVNDLVQDVRSGRMPDPGVVADLLLDKKSIAATEQVWDMLPDAVKTRVKITDLKNMIDSAAVMGKDGKKTLNPDALLASLDERTAINDLIHHPTLIRQLREYAIDLKAFNGTLDVTHLPPNQIRNALERAVAARRALETEAATNPRIALRSNNPELVEAGARYFMQPGKEAITTSGAQLLGVDSPEWKAVQRFAVMDMFKESIRPAGLGRTVAGSDIEDYLGRLTAEQQRLLFPAGNLGDIKLIARQARALFPELEKSYGASLAGANVMGALPKRRAILAYMRIRLAGAIADSPQLARALAGQLFAEPYKGRATLTWLLQGGADMGMNILEKQQPITGSEFGYLGPQAGGGKVPAGLPLPPPREEREPTYGGPNE